MRTYPDRLRGTSVSALLGRTELPQGYRHVRASTLVGHGDERFVRAFTMLLQFDMHRAAGLHVTASRATAAVGVRVRLRLGVGPIAIAAPCEVVAVIDRVDQRGFAYGTLPGHPESGEEAFLVERRVVPDSVPEVWLHIVAFSEPATWWSRLASPLNHRMQDVITRRYHRALRDFAQ